MNFTAIQITMLNVSPLLALAIIICFDLLLALATHKYALSSAAKASHRDTEYPHWSEASNQS